MFVQMSAVRDPDLDHSRDNSSGHQKALAALFEMDEKEVTSLTVYGDCDLYDDPDHDLSRNNEKVEGWNNRETSRPTSFMMTTMLVGIFVLTSKRGRRLSKPLNPVQLKYLTILEASPGVFTQTLKSSKGGEKTE